MTRVEPPWQHPERCPHPLNPTRIPGPRDCNWCGKRQASGLIGVVEVARMSEPPTNWWHQALRRFFDLAVRLRPSLIIVLQKLVVEVIVKAITEQF